MIVLNETAMQSRVKYVIQLEHTCSRYGTEWSLTLSALEHNFELNDPLTENEKTLLPTKIKVSGKAKGQSLGIIGHIFNLIPKHPLEGTELVIEKLMYVQPQRLKREHLYDMLFDYAESLGYGFITI